MPVYCKWYWELAKIKVLVCDTHLSMTFTHTTMRKIINWFVVIIGEALIIGFINSFSQFGKAECY